MKTNKMTPLLGMLLLLSVAFIMAGVYVYIILENAPYTIFLCVSGFFMLWWFCVNWGDVDDED